MGVWEYVQDSFKTDGMDTKSDEYGIMTDNVTTLHSCVDNFFVFFCPIKFYFFVLDLR